MSTPTQRTTPHPSAGPGNPPGTPVLPGSLPCVCRLGFQDVPGSGRSRMFQALRSPQGGPSHCAYPRAIGPLTVLPLSAWAKSGESQDRPGRGSRFDGRVALVPAPPALPSLLRRQLPGVPASRGHACRSSRVARGRGELHPRGRPGFPDRPGGREVVQACLLTSPAQGRGCVSRKIISHFRPRSQNKLTQSHQRPGPPDF